jgi:molecular chaperone GrpE
MNSHDPFPEQTATGPFEAASPEGAPAAEASPSDPDAALVAENVALATENANLKDQVLRTLAEMENLRRRTEREVQDASRYAVTAFARDVLSVGDNLGRALTSVSAEARTAAGEALSALLSGVEMTEREFVTTLGKHGVKRIDPAGERFDPNLHQAMFEVPDPSVASGTIVQVMQPGYVIGDRVLRPALVGVAKGGPKAAPASAADDAAGSAAAAR